MKKILIIGIDGYLGWATAIHLKEKGYEIHGIDNLLRRKMVKEVGGISAIPILDAKERQKYIPFLIMDILNYPVLQWELQRFQPDVIIHYGEIPSAPYSMIDAWHATFTHRNNVEGTLNLLWAMKEVCPDAHLIKLGTMGEYGTPNVDIPEGSFEIEYHGRKDKLPFPKQSGSWYHYTKIHDSNNIMFACRNWGLTSTDLNQGPVYGTRTDEMIDDWQRTRYDFDEVFGTVINRFVAQAVIGYPLTPYGLGGQIRGFLNINDTLQAIRLNIENPPEKGEYRVFNQFYELFSINELAKLVKEEGDKQGLNVQIKNVKNPRIEAEEHYYNPDNKGLFKLGWKPRGLKEVLASSIKDLIQFKGRIESRRDSIKPKTTWK